MATIKVACPKCGQKVSGDETFHGAVVECPICSAEILFPGERKGELPQGSPSQAPTQVAVAAVPPDPEKSNLPVASLDDVPAQATREPVPPEDRMPLPSRERAEDFDAEVPSPVFGAISMVTSVLGIVTCVGGILFSPIAVIFGHVSQAKARHSPVQPAPGQTLGAIGMMIGYVWLLITILVLALAVLFKEPLSEFLQDRGA